MPETRLHATGIPFTPTGNDIAVLMSGGVDSSVTACLLQEQGFGVVGITMKIPLLAPDAASHAVEDAVRVCHILGIPHYWVDIETEFRQCVIKPFQDGYFKGSTPNPCVNCNAGIKFGLLWDTAERELGVTRLATGHYALAVREQGRTFLRRGPNRQKDQTYFIYGIPPRRLPDFYLPLEGREKDEVRRVARERNLPVADKSESMDICFAGEGDYRAILPPVPSSPGDFLSADGKIVGRHEGIQNYTLGQRKGLRLAMGEPVYVIGIDPAANTVTVGTRAQAVTQTVCAERLNILYPEPLRDGARLGGKIRSVGDPKPCTVERLEEGRLRIRFDEEVFAPTPGQHLVVYDASGNVVAGGVICAPFCG